MTQALTDNSHSDLAPYGAEWHDAHVLRPGEVASLLAGSPWRRFAVLGDSLAEGVGRPTPGYADLTWAERVAGGLAKLHDDFEYLNLGRRHLSTAEVMREQLGPALAFRPDLVAIAAGGNDVLDPDCDIATTIATIEQGVAALQAAGATVFGFTLMNVTRAFAAGGGPTLDERVERFAASLRLMTLRRGIGLVDLAANPVALDASFYSDDMMHPNGRGHAVMASAAIELLGELVRFEDGVL